MKEIEVETISSSLESESPTMGIAPGEIVIGNLVEINEQGQPQVNFAENPTNMPLPAVSTLNVTQNQIGRQVALLFANGDPHNPVIMGLIHSPLHEILENYELAEPNEPESTEQEQDLEIEDVLIDGKRLVFEGKEEIVLKCGESSITLTKAGKIMIRGKYLLNRSTGVNRIMGGSVQVN